MITFNFETLQSGQLSSVLQPISGTYALILQSNVTTQIQIGHWREIDLQPGYYIYIGSAFGPGGVRARVSRHMRTDKPKHWHIDFLREHVTSRRVWVSYHPERLEHHWAKLLDETDEMIPIAGFGCSDCQCYSHLFYTKREPISIKRQLPKSITIPLCDASSGW